MPLSKRMPGAVVTMRARAVAVTILLGLLASSGPQIGATFVAQAFESVSVGSMVPAFRPAVEATSRVTPALEFSTVRAPALAQDPAGAVVRIGVLRSGSYDIVTLPQIGRASCRERV